MVAAECYDKADPVNLGSSEEISIRDLVTTKPDGQPRRKLNVERAKREFGFTSETPFRIGLRRTIGWFKDATAAPSVA